MHFNGVFSLNKPANSKLSKFKKWLTLPDTAKRLSVISGEDVTEADILQLALENHLKLSVNFLNQTVARRGNIVGYEDVQWGEFPIELGFKVPNLPVEAKGESLRYMESLQIDNTRFLNFSDELTTIQDVWDLPMIGCGLLHIKNKYQSLIGGPEVAFQILGGPVVEGPNELFYQVGKNCYTDLCYGPQTKAEIVKLKRLESSKSNNRRKEKLLICRRERLKVVKNIEYRTGFGRILMGHGLPEDSVLVVRTDALCKFEQLMLDNETEKNTATKVNKLSEYHARNREQVLGAAFAVLAKWPDKCTDTKNKVIAAKIADLVVKEHRLFWPNTSWDKNGPPLIADTIEGHLRKWLIQVNKQQ